MREPWTQKLVILDDAVLCVKLIERGHLPRQPISAGPFSGALSYRRQLATPLKQREAEHA